MKNGDGLRVVLWLAGCQHHCYHCQNPVTWDADDGLPFDAKQQTEIYNELLKPHIAGLTLSGGDPLHPKNRRAVYELVESVKVYFPQKTVWIYTGYIWQEILANTQMKMVLDFTDVLVDGRFVERLSDNTYHWAGSTNQRVINVRESLNDGGIVLYEGN